MPSLARALPGGVLLLLLLLCAACGTTAPRGTSPATPETPSLTLEALLQQEAATPGGRLVRLAQEQLGRPYRYGGRSPAGFDCSGLVFYVHREAGLDVPRSSREQYRASRRITREGLLPGDLVFFSISSRKISHVGIYVADGLFIHSPSTGKGVSYASMTDPYWRERLVGMGRFH